MTSKRFKVERKGETVIFSYDRYDHFSFFFIGTSLYFIIEYILNFKLDNFKTDSANDILGFLFFLIPLYLLYSIINSSFNATVLEIKFDSVSISESPIPISFTKTIKRIEIVRVFTKTDAYENEGTYQQHSIFFQLADNKEIPVFNYIGNLNECKTIESMIKRELFNIS